MKKIFHDKKIGVLMGGTSREKDISLRSGKNILDSLLKMGYKAVKIDPANDLPSQLKKEKIEIAYLALHGTPGEDGSIQGLLETMKIPYTGSKVLASALATHKVATKKIFESSGIPTPPYMEISASDDLREKKHEVAGNLGLPVVIKPISEGSSIGISIVKDLDELQKNLTLTIKEFKDVFVEKFIYGKEITIGIVGIGDKTEALPILELRPKTEFYDYEAKYTKGATQFILPAELSKE